MSRWKQESDGSQDSPPLPTKPGGSESTAAFGMGVSLEITIEYCTRQTFHTKHRPEKYEGYFQAVRRALLERYPTACVTGNSEKLSRRPWVMSDRLGPMEDVSRPRLGSFEVTLMSPRIGCFSLFSKLKAGRWPNPSVLVERTACFLQLGDQQMGWQTSARSLPPVASPRASAADRDEEVLLPGLDAVGVRRTFGYAMEEPRCQRSWTTPRSSTPPRVRRLLDSKVQLGKQRLKEQATRLGCDSLPKKKSPLQVMRPVAPPMRPMAAGPQGVRQWQKLSLSAPFAEEQKDSSPLAPSVGREGANTSELARFVLDCALVKSEASLASALPPAKGARGVLDSLDASLEDIVGLEVKPRPFSAHPSSTSMAATQPEAASVADDGKFARLEHSVKSEQDGEKEVTPGLDALPGKLEYGFEQERAEDSEENPAAALQVPLASHHPRDLQHQPHCAIASDPRVWPDHEDGQNEGAGVESIEAQAKLANAFQIDVSAALLAKEARCCDELAADQHLSDSARCFRTDAVGVESCGDPSSLELAAQGYMPPTLKLHAEDLQPTPRKVEEIVLRPRVVSARPPSSSFVPDLVETKEVGHLDTSLKFGTPVQALASPALENTQPSQQNDDEAEAHSGQEHATSQQIGDEVEVHSAIASDGYSSEFEQADGESVEAEELSADAADEGIRMASPRDGQMSLQLHAHRVALEGNPIR